MRTVTMLIAALSLASSAAQPPAPTPTPTATTTPAPAHRRPANQPVHQHEGGAVVHGSGRLPAGWKVRFDDPGATPDQIVVEEKAGTLTFTTGPAGIYYKDHRAEKDFDVSAVFSQLKPAAMPEAYGLFIGGQDLDKDTQRYTYFLIRQDGKYLIKTRNGAATKTIVDWTDAPSMREPKGVKSSNTLAIRATANSVQFLVDEKSVHAMTRTELGPDGLAGLRINHNLHVQAGRFAVKKLP